MDLPTEDVDEADFPSIEDVVREIQSLPPSIVIPARGSLLEYLERTTIHAPSFDADEWDRQWARIEADLDAIENESGGAA